ncbi:MAG: hypothetical protein RL230_3060 [Pseudomonadota bacterium]
MPQQPRTYSRVFSATKHQAVCHKKRSVIPLRRSAGTEKRRANFKKCSRLTTAVSRPVFQRLLAANINCEFSGMVCFFERREC